jgi:hypothetical protein
VVEIKQVFKCGLPKVTRPQFGVGSSIFYKLSWFTPTGQGETLPEVLPQATLR